MPARPHPHFPHLRQRVPSFSRWSPAAGGGSPFLVPSPTRVLRALFFCFDAQNRVGATGGLPRVFAGSDPRIGESRIALLSTPAGPCASSGCRRRRTRTFASRSGTGGRRLRG